MKRLLLFGFTSILLACSGGNKPTTQPAPVVTEPAQPPAGEKPAAVDPAYAKAKLDVQRLAAEASKHVLLAPWTGPHGGVPPWDKVKVSEFPAAFALGLELLAAEIALIANNPEPPTFANTIAALDDAGRYQSRAETLFSVQKSSLNTPEVQALDREWSPKLAAAYDAITFDAKLFARISAVHAAREKGLSPEEKRLVELRYDRFVNAGAKLTADQKTELGRINQEMAVLFSDFGNRVLADENTWVVLEKKADLAGLPASLVGSYKAAADERSGKAIKPADRGDKAGDKPAEPAANKNDKAANKEAAIKKAAGMPAVATGNPNLAGKWVVVNTRSSVDPFLTSSSRRDLREKVWKAFKNRGDNGNANDTNELIAKIVGLRQQRAKLVGYPTHAHWRMFNTMAVDPKKAEELMLRVWPAAVARVKEEVADMQKIATKEGMRGKIEPWDYLYYAEKVRKAKYALDQDALKPYFELNNMIAGSFFMAEQLYDITFEEITGKVAGFHPDVRVWEVKDKASGKHRGLFYGDYFARAGKRSGAWASGYRGHETFTGTKRTAITSNNNNFVKGAAGEPVLISLDDAQTLFHEFGHALHGLLSEVNYPGLSSTPRDFVEYPSQVHEMWVMTRPVLDRFGLHYKTKEKMPQALLDKVEASKRFNQGYATVEYLSSAIVDMALHTTNEKIDPDAFERDTLTKIGAPKEVVMRHRLPQFNHLFTSDSYSAGYYSYLWSEVMDADTRQAFVEAGDVFHKPTADKMRKYILSPGNSTDRTEAYRQFRGRDPDVKALLEKRGFPTKN